MDQPWENADGSAAARFVEGLQSGRPEFVEAFYESHFLRIFDFARHRVRDAAEAEDLAQEIFLAAMRSIDSYQARANFDSWLFGVARNVVHEHLRTTQRRQAREALLQRGSAPPTPEEELRERRTVEALSRRLAAAEPWQAEAFALRYFERLPWSEIARRTERTPRTLSTSLERLLGRIAIDLGL